jgi:hypothetical protein
MVTLANWMLTVRGIAEVTGRTWPWARDLAATFARLAALPVPAG